MYLFNLLENENIFSNYWNLSFKGVININIFIIVNLWIIVMWYEKVFRRNG